MQGICGVLSPQESLDDTYLSPSRWCIATEGESMAARASVTSQSAPRVDPLAPTASQPPFVPPGQEVTAADTLSAGPPPAGRFDALHAPVPSTPAPMAPAASSAEVIAKPVSISKPVATALNAPLYGVTAGLVAMMALPLPASLQPRHLPHHLRAFGLPGTGEEPRRRPKTMSRREMLRERRRRERAGELMEVAIYDRPQTRADCVDGPRPCLFVACKHHLYLDVNPETGSIKINFPDRDVWELEETCALDVAERGGVTLEEVGDILNLTRERVRQVEVTGLMKLKGDSPQHELDVFIGWDPHPEES